MGTNRTFGPIFHRDEFMVPLLELQEKIKSLEAEYRKGDEVISVKLTDVCNNPLSRPNRPSEFCNIQSIWGYWQDDLANFDSTPFWSLGNKSINYLDHFLECVK